MVGYGLCLWSKSTDFSDSPDIHVPACVCVCVCVVCVCVFILQPLLSYRHGCSARELKSSHSPK